MASVRASSNDRIERARIGRNVSKLHGTFEPIFLVLKLPRWVLRSRAPKLSDSSQRRLAYDCFLYNRRRIALLASREKTRSNDSVMPDYRKRRAVSTFRTSILPQQLYARQQFQDVPSFLLVRCTGFVANDAHGSHPPLQLRGSRQ